MDGYLPTKPGWYANPDDPRALRYWDGRSWTSRSRSQPNWASRSEVFEPNYEEVDRSVEGPVHPHEVRERVASGAWPRGWLLPWRARQPERGWSHVSGTHPSLGSRPRWSQPPARLRRAHRSLLLVVGLSVAVLAVLTASAALMAPYGTRSTPLAADLAARTRFAAQASKACAATLPKVRDLLVLGRDGPSIAKATAEVAALGRDLASLPTATSAVGPVDEWLTAWHDFTNYEGRFAASIGPAASLGPGGSTGHGGSTGPVGVRPGRLAPSRPTASRPAASRISATVPPAALQERDRAAASAALADHFASDLGVPACHLEPAPGD
jgi:hypothetical protein